MAHPLRQDPFNNMEAYSASEQQEFDSNYQDQGQYPPNSGHGMYHQDSNGYMQGRPADHMVTPGVDNFGHAAAGGVAGLAYGVADRNAGTNPFDGADAGLPPPPSQAHLTNVPRSLQPGQNGSYSPQNPFMGPSSPSSPSPDASYSNLDAQSANGRYQYQTSPVNNNRSHFGAMDPNDIVDDGDDGLEYAKHRQMGSSPSAASSGRGAKAGAGLAAGAAAGGAFGQGYAGDKADHQLDDFDSGRGGRGGPAAALAQEESRKRTKRWIILITIFVIIAGGIVGGVVGGLIKNSKNGGKETTGAGKSGNAGAGKGGGNGGGKGGANSGDLNLHSPEIQSLLGNKNLHKVFFGMDYTPQQSQYPACLADPPSQDDITKDVAVLSQLTNTIRLYGTDCNQTEMVLYAISQLEMNDTIKVWMGVWQDNNSTTNQRQLDQMWTILDTYGADPFSGIIVANEALFREQFTITTLSSLLSQVRQKVDQLGYNLPVATSDLGDNWTAALSSASDLLMANVHPFFAGVDPGQAAAWTYSFWEDHDGPYFKSDNSKNVIAETGWPTGGGTDCGGPATCKGGSVAGIPGLNQFMADWVCQALTNGTRYFWFEAFDEPWKEIYNVPGQAWEDKWGLMTVDREIKDGVKIPDCGGKTVD